MKLSKKSIINMLVSTTDHDEGTVFKVLQQHESNPFMFLLGDNTPHGIVSGGWSDISILQKPTKTQLKNQPFPWKHNEPLNVEFLGAARAVNGQDY